MEQRYHSDWQIFDETGRRKYLTAAERKRFIAAANEASMETRALCLVLAYTGCRVSEALALRPEHVDESAGVITLPTLKRRKRVFRRVPVPPQLIQLLSDLSPPDANKPYFTMHRTTAWRRVKKIMDQRAVHGPMACCRGLRHGFGMHAAESAVPPNLIQRWLGHAQPTTTFIYLDAVGQEERALAKRMW